ncbi:hypothetical protein T10_1116, partial [Trichinella papuae]
APLQKKVADRPVKAEEPRPVRANLASLFGSFVKLMQTVKPIAHGEQRRNMSVNCLFGLEAEGSFILQNVADRHRLRGE